ncbi:cullin-1 [Trifolium repens]|nr:cullin-1 [Trifolium repens]
MEHRRINDFDEGWKRIEIGITKLIRNVEGLPDTQFSSDEYMMLYTTIYDLGYRHGFSPNLYDKCKETIDEFNRSNLDELLLRELVQRMLMHKTFVTRLSHLFAILNQSVTRSLPPLNQLGLSSFRDVVFMEVQAKAVIDLIRKDRAGEQIDKLLLKNVIDIFVEIDMGDIELLDETANDYKLKAEPKPPAKTCETMIDIKRFKKSIEGLITLNYVKKDKDEPNRYLE